MSQIRLAEEAVQSLKVTRGVAAAVPPQVNPAQVAECCAWNYLSVVVSV